MAFPSPCLCNEENRLTAAFATNPTPFGKGLLDASISTHEWRVGVFVDSLRKVGFTSEAEMIHGLSVPSQRLIFFLHDNNNPKQNIATIASFVAKVSEHSTSETACDALESHYIVPRKSDLTLSVWYNMVPSTHVCN